MVELMVKKTSSVTARISLLFCNLHNTYLIHQLLNNKISLLYLLVSVLIAKAFNVHHRDGVEVSGLDHPVNQLPLSGEGVELQDFIRVGTVITALIFISKLL